MRSIRSFLSYCCLAALACFGFSGVAFADEYDALSLLHVAVADVGYHGAESAKFRAEQHYMCSVDAVSMTVTGSLVAESNGYRLSELVNVAGSVSEVAKGKIGVGAGNVA